MVSIKPTGKAHSVMKTALMLLVVCALSGCMTTDPVPDWVLICHDTGGGESCPPNDSADATDDISADDVELGPSG